MNILLVLFLICIGIFSCVSWLIPALLSWLFKRKYHIKLKIGRIVFPKLIFRDVNLSKDGYSVHISEVSLKSSFFNSEINKLVSVVIKSFQVTNYTEERRSAVVETILKPLLSKQNSKSEGLDDEASHHSVLERGLSSFKQQTLLDFRNKKLPSSLITFAQFMGVHIYEVLVSITLDGLNIHGTAEEFHADGTAGGPARALVFSANIVNAKIDMWTTESTVLGEAQCSMLVEGTVRAEGPLNVEKIHTIISKPTILLRDEFYIFIQNRKKRKSGPETYRSEDHYNSLIPRLSPVIPKIFSLKIDTTKVTCIERTPKTFFELTLQSTLVNSRFSASSSGASPQLYVAVQLDKLGLAVRARTLAALDKLKLDAKLEKRVLNLYLIISSLNLKYNHEDALEWYTVWRRLKKSRPLRVTHASDNVSEGRWWRAAALAVAVQGCAELRTATLAAGSLAAGCGGLKVKLEQLTDTREECYEWEPARLVLGSRHWSAELLVDGGWLRASATGPSGRDPPPRRQHAWGSAMLAVALVKWSTHGPRESKIEAMMDCLRFEYSHEFAETLISLVDSVNEYRAVSTPPAPGSESSLRVAVNVALSHINVFLIVNEDICLMTRVDDVTLERTDAKSTVLISGLKMVEMVPYKGNVICQRCDEMTSSFFHVKLARVEHVPSKERNSVLLDFQFQEYVEVQWSANLHLKILTFVRAFRCFRQELQMKLNRGSGMSNTVNKKGRAIDWRVSFKSQTNLELLLSEKNNMSFATDDMTIAYDHEAGLSIQWSQLKMILNDDEIISVEGYCQRRVTDDSHIRVERKACDGFQLAWNRVWGVNVASVRVIFPYKHRFADAVQGDFVSLFKWIKMIHGIKKKPFTADSPLPSDLYIKIDEIVIEMSDDPFEVKLRDNYELLEDEYKESQKRRTMLDAKVQELCKPHLFLPAGKVEELYAALRHKDAQIYVQRSRAAPPPRTRLVACCVAGLRLLALADPVLHGAPRATRRLREIDADCPWPEDGVEFTTLWCRSVSVFCDLWQLRLRDFPQPLLSMSDLRLWGTLLGAEEAPPPRAVRTVIVEQGAPWGPVELERSMMPLKWYYDLCCEMTEYSYAFGPCWEPVIAHCNLAFDQVSRPSLDPSAPLAWWDKVRLLFHGRLTVNCAKFTCLLHVSLDPYNTTEEMEVTWSDLVLDWTNGKLGFLGELKVFVRTASKYDDCRVLRVPGLRLAVKMGWQVVGDARDHRAVTPCAPTRLPEYSSNQEHDSYRAFRSQGVDLHLGMDTRPIQGDGPALLLYGSTLRWFESLKLILSGTTRPTRRGRAFANMRPRRPQLSRHYRNVSVSLTLHNLQVFYWSSSSMQRGIEMLCARVTCGSRHRLSLAAGGDALIRRARALWATLYMNCELNDAEIWLKTASQTQRPRGAADGDDDAVRITISFSRVGLGRRSARRMFAEIGGAHGEVLLPVRAPRVVRPRGGRRRRSARAPPGRARAARRLDQAQQGPGLRAHRHLHEDAAIEEEFVDEGAQRGREAERVAAASAGGRRRLPAAGPPPPRRPPLKARRGAGRAAPPCWRR